MVLPLSIPSPNDYWQVFNLGEWIRGTLGFTGFPLNIDLRASTACTIIGIVLALILTSRRLTQRGAEPGIVIDFAVGAIIAGIVVGRIGHVATHFSDYFGAGRNPLTALFVWEGGMSLFGAVLGGVIGVAIVSRITGLRAGAVLDAAVPGLLLGSAIVRLGDWFERQYFGTPTGAPWGLQIPSTDPDFPVGLAKNTLFQPVFAYEIIWDLVGIALLLFLAKRSELQWGKVFALYLVWYGLGRSWFESLRIDPTTYLAGIRINVWIAWLVVVIGLVAFLALRRQHPGQEPSVYRQGRGWSPAPAVDSGDTYPEVDESNDALVATSARTTSA